MSQQRLSSAEFNHNLIHAARLILTEARRADVLDLRKFDRYRHFKDTLLMAMEELQNLQARYATPEQYQIYLRALKEVDPDLTARSLSEEIFECYKTRLNTIFDAAASPRSPENPSAGSHYFNLVYNEIVRFHIWACGEYHSGMVNLDPEFMDQKENNKKGYGGEIRRFVRMNRHASKSKYLAHFLGITTKEFNQTVKDNSLQEARDLWHNFFKKRNNDEYEPESRYLVTSMRMAGYHKEGSPKFLETLEQGLSEDVYRDLLGYNSETYIPF